MDTVVEILIDISGSMGTMKGQGVENENKYLLPDGSTRILLAKKILSEEIIPTIDYAKKIIIRTFNAEHVKEHKPVIAILYEGVYDRNLVNEKLSSLPNDTPVGGTPITAAIIAAVDNLKSNEYTNYERLIILVTDGEENGGGDYKVAAENAMSIDGIKCKVHIIGISLDMEAEKKAKQLSETTDGTYLPLRATNYNSAEIRKALAPLKVSVVQESLKNIASHHVNPSPVTAAKIEALEKKLETIVNEKEYNLLADQIEILKSKIDEVQIINQKQISELFSILEKHQLPLLISSIETNISQMLKDSLSALYKSYEELSLKYSLLNDANARKFEKLEVSSIDLMNKTNDLAYNQSSQFSSLNEILKNLVDLQKTINQIEKKQQNRSYVTWALILLALIVSIAVYSFKK